MLHPITQSCARSPGQPCDLKDLGPFTDRSGLVGEVSVRRCVRCGLGVSMPPLPDVSFLYADRTSQDFQPHSGRLAQLIKRIAFRLEARKLLAQAGGRPTRAVDFGCGSGLFTRCLAEELPEGATAMGSDFHTSAPAELGPVPYAPMADLARHEGQADLVTSMHVIEHDDDPAALLGRILNLARPGGSVVIEVPNIDCFWTGVFGRHWDAWYLPYHRVHFSRESFRRLAEASGLQVLREVDVSVPTMGRTLANMLGRRNGLAFILLSAVLYPLQWSLERVTRRPTALRIVGRKI